MKAYIARLSISVEAHAVNGLVGGGRDGAPQSVTREVLWSGKVGTNEDPVIVVEETEGSEDGDQRDMFIIWKLTAQLSKSYVLFYGDIPINSSQLVHEYGFRLQEYCLSFLAF